MRDPHWGLTPIAHNWTSNGQTAVMAKRFPMPRNPAAGYLAGLSRATCRPGRRDLRPISPGRGRTSRYADQVIDKKPCELYHAKYLY
jgi:hypothetical protein